MNKATQVNFVSENPETAPGTISEEVTEVMGSTENDVEIVLDMQSKYMKNKSGNAKSKIDKVNGINFVTKNPETALGTTTSEGVTEVMDPNENGVDVVPAMQPRYMKNKSGNAESKMDKDAEIIFVPENPETAPETASERVTEVMDSNEHGVDVASAMQSKYMKNKTGNAKSKIQNYKTKGMTVASAAERKSLKRKVAHPPTSQMVMDSIMALKKRHGVSFEDIRKYMEEKYVVDMKFLKHHVAKFLQKGVDNGVLEKIDRGGAEGRFKIKKSENIKKDPKTVPRKERKVKPGKKMAATKKQVKK